MNFDTLDLKYVEAAALLAQSEYEKAMHAYPALYKTDYTPDFKHLLTHLFNTGSGLVALEDESLAGYLAYYGPIDDMFGYVKGAFSPIHGNAFAGSDRIKTASLLFEKTSQKLLDQSILQYGLSLYTNDQEILQTFSLNGFGYRCADGILDLRTSLDIQENKDVTYEEIQACDTAKVLPLKNALAKHMGSTPTYFPILEETELEFEEKCSESTSRFFTATYASQLVGYVEVTGEGETFLTEAEDYRHLCGAYLLPEYRGQNILQSLLKHVAQTLVSEGIEKLGVDCETLNPSAFGFWSKYFEIYAYSVVRRLDERVLL